MKKNLAILTVIMLFMFFGVSYATESVSLIQAFYDNFKMEFLPMIKQQLLPILINTIQLLLYTLFTALVAYLVNYVKKLIDIKAVDDELDKGYDLMVSLLNDSLNSKEYKDLKQQYVEGKINKDDFFKKAFILFKEPIINTVANKGTDLGKSILELAEAKFGDGKKYLSGKLEEFLNELKKK